MSNPNALDPDQHPAGFGGPTTLSRAELREASISSIRWISATRLIAEIGMFASVVAMARLLPPAEFGHAAVALVMGPLAVILMFEGFGTVLVQRANVERTHVGAATLASLLLGAVLTGLTFVAVPVVAAPLFGERTASLMQLMAPVFVIGALGSVPRAALLRRLDFRRLSIIEVAGLLPGGLSAVILAASGRGAEALIIGYLVTQSIQAALLFASAPIRELRFSRAGLRDVGSFGTPTALAGLTAAGRRNVDYVMLGIQVNPAILGIYYRAFHLGVEYQQKVSTILVRLVLPVYSRTESLEDMRSIHAKITRMHSVLIYPLLGALIAVAPVFIPWLFGERWEPAVVPTQILAIGGMASTLLAGHMQVIVAAGKPRALLSYNLATIVVYGGVVFAVAPLGLTAIAWAVAGIHVAMLVSTYHLLLDRLVGIPLSTLWREVLPAAAGTLVVVAVGVATVETAVSVSLPAPATIAGAVVVSAASYMLVLRWAFQSVWAEFVELGARFRGGARRRIPGRADEGMASA